MPEPIANPKKETKKKEYIRDEQPEKKIEITAEMLQRVRYREFRDDAMKMFNTSKESRRRYDWEWLMRDLYRRGYQFSRYDPTNKTVLISSRTSIKIPINLLWVQMRTIKNQVTSFRPKWEVMPKGKGDQSVANARYSGKLLDHFYDIFNLRKLIKETIIQGLLYSVGGPWQIGYDPDGDDGDGEITIWLLDTFDFYIDSTATSLDEAEFCIKAVRKPIDVIKKNPQYKFYEGLDQITGEGRLAASEYKQFLLQALKNQVSYDDSQEGGILYECWNKVRIGEDNKDEIAELLRKDGEDASGLRMGETVMRVITYLDYIVDPLKVQHVRRDDFPFELYQADINPVEVYGESWAKHVIPANRVLNALESSVFQYNYKYAIGRIVMDKNAGVRIVTNEHGELVQKNQGAEVTSLPLQPLPTSYDMQLKSMRSYIEDIGGAHEVSRGIIPTNVRSGVGIAEMKQADSTNSADLVDNMEDFLVRVGKKILKEVAKNYDVPKMIEALGKNGEPDHFMVVGEKAGKKRKDQKKVKIGVDEFDIAMIGDKNQITVNIGSWLAYTKEAQHEKLKEYYEGGLIDQQTFLEHAEFPDVNDILERTRKEATLKQFRGQTAGSEQGASDEEIAEQENVLMVYEGREIEPLETDNHAVHKIIHEDHLDNPLVEAHVSRHEEMMSRPQRIQPGIQQQQGGMQTGVPAQAGAMTGMIPTPGMMTPQMPPEEAALTQSLQGLIGGQQNAPIQ